MSGVCPPNCTITPSGFSVSQMFSTFFERERLEVQAVAGVVIGRDGLRIAVDHDRFDAEFLQRERRVAAAVIELDSLADAVGAAAQDHDFLARRSASASHADS